MNLLSIFLQAADASGRISIQDGIIETLIFVAIGMGIAFLAFKLIDIITPGNLSKQIADGNVAQAILAGALILGVCIIIAAVLSS